MLKLLLAICIVLLLLLIGLVMSFFFVLQPADRALFFSQKQTIQSQNTTRSYRTVAPKNSDKKPLLIGLHGFRDRGLWLGAYSGVHLLAEQENIVIALPDGRQQSWNGTFCCGWSYLNNAEDTEFILDMIEDIKSRHAIDESRIYIFGFSNGGLMAQRMIAEHPGVFAGAASFMSGVGDNDNMLDVSDAKTPLLLVNGTKDVYVPVETPRKIPGFNFIPAHQTADIWANQFGLSGKTSTSKKDHTEYRWNNADGTESSRLALRIYESRHRWPQWRLPHFSSTTPKPTQDMWEFLKQHSL